MSKLALIFCAVSLMTFSIPSFAAHKNDMKFGAGSACKPDVDKYCSDVTPGEGRIAACLKAHDDKLSTGCQKEWKSAQEEMRSRFRSEVKAFRQACNKDVQKYCSNVLDPMEISQCLTKHSMDLSKSCRQYEANAREKATSKASS